MSNKKIFKNMYSSKINKDNNYNKILNKIHNHKIKSYKQILIPVTSISLIIFLILININESSLKNSDHIEDYNNNLHTNTTINNKNSNKNESYTYSDNYDSITTTKSECDHKPRLYYQYDNRKIYTYCLNKVELIIDNKTIELKDYLKNNTLDSLIKELELISSLYDGGTNVYNDGGSKRITNNGITLIKCNTIDGNKDIYIGNKDMQYKSNFCKDNNNTFTRTYTIKKVKNYTKQQYENGSPVTYAKSLEVTLSQFQGETKTVIINNISKDLIENNTYEFEFMLYEDNKNIEDTIESIFKNTHIVEVRLTEKVGLSQIQESIK